MSKLSLVNILRNTLLQVEENIQSGEDGPAVSELRKQIALTVAEVELIKDKRSAIAEHEPRLFLVSRRRPRLVEKEAKAQDSVTQKLQDGVTRVEQRREDSRLGRP